MLRSSPGYGVLDATPVVVADEEEALIRTILINTALLLALSLAWGPASAEDAERDTYVERGEASWYGPGFHGQQTASGAEFDQTKLTAAHPELPFGTRVTVTNLENGREVKVKINDRGPSADGRIIDVSKAAAKKLDMVSEGSTEVRIEANVETAQ
jgi:rare lipoprotein A